MGQLTALQNLQVHGNVMTGSIPQELGQCTQLQVLKAGRNPFTGTLPTFTGLKKLQKFNCNFCALEGTFPDTLKYMPELQQAFWCVHARNRQVTCR